MDNSQKTAVKWPTFQTWNLTCNITMSFVTIRIFRKYVIQKSNSLINKMQMQPLEDFELTFVF